MKSFLPVTLGIVCVVLVVALYMTSQSNTAQHQADVASITDFSNQLGVAQTQVAIHEGMIMTLSNSLSACQSASSALSNQLTDAQSAQAADAEQITNLNAKVSDMETAGQAKDRNLTELTNQITGLTQQLAASKSSLTDTNQALVQANKDYYLLENRFRVNVAERLVTERKFDNPTELQEQLARLKNMPVGEVSADQIYAGLDVEVRSNGTFHVITPN